MPPEPRPSDAQARGDSRLLRAGDVFAGKYRIDSVLGQGGMGVVYGATHLVMRERVAIKMLLPESAMSGDAVERFLREGRTAARIKSEHVGRVFDVAVTDSGTPYLVLEYLEGIDLADLRARATSGRLPPQQVVDHVLQACEALAEAHAVGTVHRDLKPSNLYLTTRADGSPCVKVLDFGISKIAGTPADMSVTKTSAVLGSPLYMSPEQLRRASDVDVRADLWSLAVIVFELVCGRPPFFSDNFAELSAAVLMLPPPSMRSLRPDVPEELDRVVLRSLEKNREHRYPDVVAFTRALAPFGSDAGRASAERVARVYAQHGGEPRLATTSPTLARPAESGAALEALAHARTLPNEGESSPAIGGTSGSAAGPRVRRPWLVAAAFGALVGVVGFAGIGWRDRRITHEAAGAGEGLNATAEAPPPTAPAPVLAPGPAPASSASESAVASASASAPASVQPAHATVRASASPRRRGSSSSAAPTPSSKAPAVAPPVAPPPPPAPATTTAPAPPSEITRDRHG